MDFADGGDLQSKIKAQKGKNFSESLIIDWFTQICLSVKHIHDRKILHRDIKSQNIFLTKNGLVKLGDFGIAKCLDGTLDKAKTIVGTPYYLSPEIVNNKPYAFKSDIWSLGILLYEMCALKMPFDGNSLPQLSLKISSGAYNPLPPCFSRELRNLVAWMLNKEINKRPNINEILKQSIVKSRIKQYLNEVEYSKEFSHTILHNFNVLKDKPKDNHPNIKTTIDQITLATNPSQSSIQTSKEKKNIKDIEMNINNMNNINNNNNNLNVNTPSQNQKPIIFDKNNINNNVNINMKNIIELNNKGEVNKEKKNYHYEKKVLKNDSEEKKEKDVNIKDKRRVSGNINPDEPKDTNRNNKDRKKEVNSSNSNYNNNNVISNNSGNVGVSNSNNNENKKKDKCS